MGSESLGQVRSCCKHLVTRHALVSHTKPDQLGPWNPVTKQHQPSRQRLIETQTQPCHIHRCRHALLDLTNLQERTISRDEKITCECQCGSPVDRRSLQCANNDPIRVEQLAVNSTPFGREVCDPCRLRVVPKLFQIKSRTERVASTSQDNHSDVIVLM